MATRKKKKKKNTRPILLRILLFPLSLLVIILLPFLLMLRVSVSLHDWFQVGAWLGVAVGMILALIPVYFYVRWIFGKLRGKKKEKPEHKRLNIQIAVGILAGYCVFALFYVSGVNAKSDAIREQYTSLHPLLRVGVSSIILFDRSLVITDLARTPEDYEKMNLAKKNKSLHFPQSDGFVHAIDLRTNGRPEWRNKFTQFWFKLMGFRTLRHVGTADHLHVSLSIPENPAAL